MKLLRLNFAGSSFIPYGDRSLRRPFHIGASILRPAGQTTRAKKVDLRGRVLPAVSAKNVVPQWRAHAITGMIVLKMVPQVVLLQPRPDAFSHGEMMGRVVQRIIKNVAADQSGHDRRTKLAKDEREQYVKENCQRNAHQWRHDQPAGVIGIIVMDAVHDKMQRLSKSSVRLVMEDKPMNHVLQQCPN